MNVEHPALVLGLGETGLAVVRALGRAGIPVIGLDSRRRIGSRSKYVSASLCPHPVDEEDKFVECLRACARGHASAPPVLFVTADRYLHAVSAPRNPQDLGVVWLGPSPSVARRCLDKHLLYIWCLAHDTNVPRSVHVSGLNNAQADLSALAFPVFAKPSSSTRRAPFGRAKGALATNLVAAKRIVAEATRRGDEVLVQEVVEGPDDHSFKYCACVAPDGRFLLEFSLQKIRNYPAHFGVGSCCVSRVQPEVMALGRRVFTLLGYRGVGSIEFKRDARDGQWKLIEINARYWQQTALPTACGMNFPVAHYLAATGQACPTPTTFDEGVAWVSLDRDARSYVSYRREDALTRRAWRASCGGRRVLSDFEWDDPWPVLASPTRWWSAARWAALTAGVWTG